MLRHPIPHLFSRFQLFNAKSMTFCPEEHDPHRHKSWYGPVAPADPDHPPRSSSNLASADRPRCTPQTPKTLDREPPSASSGEEAAASRSPPAWRPAPRAAEGSASSRAGLSSPGSGVIRGLPRHPSRYLEEEHAVKQLPGAKRPVSESADLVHAGANGQNRLHKLPRRPAK